MTVTLCCLLQDKLLQTIKSKLHVAADLSLVTQSYTTTCFLVVKLKKQSKRQIQNQNTHGPGFPAPAGLWHSGSCFFSNQLYTVMSSASLWTRSTVQSSSQTEPARTRCLSEPGRGQRGGGGAPSLWYGRRPVHVHGLRHKHTTDSAPLTWNHFKEVTLFTLFWETSFEFFFKMTNRPFLFNSPHEMSSHCLQLWKIICSWAADELLR